MVKTKRTGHVANHLVYESACVRATSLLLRRNTLATNSAGRPCEAVCLVAIWHRECLKVWIFGKANSDEDGKKADEGAGFRCLWDFV